jgi:hypothetical protein
VHYQLMIDSYEDHWKSYCNEWIRRKICKMSVSENINICDFCELGNNLLHGKKLTFRHFEHQLQIIKFATSESFIHW